MQQESSFRDEVTALTRFSTNSGKAPVSIRSGRDLDDILHYTVCNAPLRHYIPSKQLGRLENARMAPGGMSP